MDDSAPPRVVCNALMGRYGRRALAVVAIAAVSLTACSDDDDLKDHFSFCEMGLYPDELSAARRHSATYEKVKSLMS